MIETKIICDSLAGSDIRLTTFLVTYPRYVHSELMTHRVFSRNASSSRAIPVNKQLQMIKDCPAIPYKFYKNKPGMQGTELLLGAEHDKAVSLWLKGRDLAMGVAEEMLDLNMHKQNVNRILEPYAHITVVITSTDYDNFFALRDHKDAEPTIQELARSMIKDYENSTPQFLEDGEWHVPFIDEETIADTNNTYLDNLQLGKDVSWFDRKVLIKRSVAKCARTSYLTREGTPTTVEKDLDLYSKLVVSEPLHASPAEHQAMACSDPSVRSGNFSGWVQYRKTLKNERCTKYVRNSQ